jgi:hypothetical protein
LHGLLGDDPALRAWAQGAPDPAWAGWLGEQGLAPYTWQRLKSSGAASVLPPPLGQALRGAYYAAVADAELHAAELRDVLTQLAAAGVTPVLFKGAALAYTAYPDPACRPMGDLDLWVTAEAMPRARAALVAAGYREHAKSERPPDMQRDASGEVQLIGTTPGHGLVELHWGTFAGEWLRRTAAVDNANILCRAKTVVAAGCDAWTLDTEDALLQLAVHLAVNHQMAYPGVRGLLDVALLARAARVDWPALAERARAWQVATPTWLVLKLTDELLGLDGAEEAICALRPTARREGLIHRFVDGQHVLEGRDMTGGPRRLAFQLLLVDQSRDAVRLVARTLWPENGWLRARYGRAGPGVRARHLARALRGRI